MKTGAKAALMLAGAATLAASAPAQARHYYDNDRIDAGDIIAGALIIGGIAAIATAASKSNRDYGYRDRYRDRDHRHGDGYYDYDRPRYSSRQAVEQCVHAARNKAKRIGWARVTDVTRIDRVRGGYEIQGRLVVEDRGRWDRRWGRGDDRWGHRYDRYDDGYDKGRFTCVARYGQVDRVHFSGLEDRYY